jgi:hypothetical protein
MLHLLLAIGLGSPAAAGGQSDLIGQACRAPAGARPELPGIVLADQLATPGDLPAIQVTSTATGAHMLVYHDAISEPAARARAACFGAQLALLEREVGDDRRDAEWDSVVFANDSAYAPPRGDNVVTRWVILTTEQGQLSDAAERLILSTMPHEQMHEYQTRAGAKLPRWFSKGHATWVGLKVLALLDPSRAVAERLKRENDLAASTQPLMLSEWGGLQPRPEAILRQLSPEDRIRFLNDPTFRAGGAFTFGPRDMIGDESNSLARYGAALKIFVGLEERHGAAAVHAWVSEMTRTGTTTRLTSAAVAASIQSRFNEDITPLLE